MGMLARSLLLFACAASALRVPQVSRRAVLLTPTAALVGGSVAPVKAADSRALDDIKVLTSKAKSLKSYVRQTSANRRSFPMDPKGGNYINIENGVIRAKKEVLLPLQTAMAAYAAATTLKDAELQKQLALQPLLMKGHLLELDQALKESKFDQYTSKTTGDTYPGGKVERELEEVCETADDFLALAAGRPAPVRDD